MKYVGDGKVADPEKAMGLLLALISAESADKGRVAVGPINRSFREAGGMIDEYGRAMDLSIERGLIEMHPSGGYFIWTTAGLAGIIDEVVP